MNSLVTALSDTSVMSISCFEMSVSRRSNGPSKFDRETRKPDSPSDASTGSATGGSDPDTSLPEPETALPAPETALPEPKTSLPEPVEGSRDSPLRDDRTPPASSNGTVPSPASGGLAPSLRDGATGDQLPRQSPIRLC